MKARTILFYFSIILLFVSCNNPTSKKSEPVSLIGTKWKLDYEASYLDNWSTPFFKHDVNGRTLEFITDGKVLVTDTYKGGDKDTRNLSYSYYKEDDTYCIQGLAYRGANGIENPSYLSYCFKVYTESGVLMEPGENPANVIYRKTK